MGSHANSADGAVPTQNGWRTRLSGSSQQLGGQKTPFQKARSSFPIRLRKAFLFVGPFPVRTDLHADLPGCRTRPGERPNYVQVQVNLCLHTLSGLTPAKIPMQQNLMCQEHRLAVCSWDPARPPQQFEPRKRTRQHGLPIESQLTKGTGILGQCGCGCAGKRDASHDEDSERGRSGNRVLRCTDREIDVFRTAPPQIGKVPCAQNHLRQLGRYTAKCEVVSSTGRDFSGHPQRGLWCTSAATCSE